MPLNLFRSGPRPLKALHDRRNGRLDAKKLARYIGVPPSALAKGLGLDYELVEGEPCAENIQNALKPVARILELLDQIFGSRQQARSWLTTPHPDLDGSALDTILGGNVGAVLLILENAIAGIPV